MNLAEKYIDDVLNGRIVTGKDIYLQCERHVNDLKQQKKKVFSYYFDEEAAEQVIKFAAVSFFGKGRLSGQHFKLEGWQAALLWQVYGWKRKDTHTRKYKQVYVKVARKNGKTEFLSLIGNYGFTNEAFKGPEKDPEIYWAATKKDQAKYGWSVQKSQLGHLSKYSPKVGNYCKILTHNIDTTKGTGFVRYLGKDSKTEDGLSPYYGLVDEYHEHPSNDMVNVLVSGMGARISPLLWIITTAGFNPQSPCAQFEKRCKDILRGSIDNDTILPWIFDLDPEDDWHDEDNWPKANPNLGVSVNMEFLRDQYRDAVTMGADKEANFLTKNLNKWVSARVTFIKDATYCKNMGEIDMEALKGKICYGGLDLASVNDTNAFCLYFPEQDGLDKACALWWYWMPEDNVRDRVSKDGIPYLDWIRDGYITQTPGNVTDYNILKQEIQEIAEQYDLISVGYDRWNSSQLVIDLLELGLPFEKFGQGFGSMNAPTKEYQRLMLTERILVGKNPVSRWHNSNITIDMNPAGDIKINKGKSSEKVDGMIALVMAIGEKMDKHNNQGSVYDERDIIIL